LFYAIHLLNLYKKSKFKIKSTINKQSICEFCHVSFAEHDNDLLATHYQKLGKLDELLPNISFLTEVLTYVVKKEKIKHD